MVCFPSCSGEKVATIVWPSIFVLEALTSRTATSEPFGAVTVQEGSPSLYRA